MVFTERHHAFISATFYRLLKEQGFPSFRAAFRFATRRYAETRGQRMAQRAIRDGHELDFAAYRYYGEWAFTDNYIESLNGIASKEVVEAAENYTYRVLRCPWADVYHEMNLYDGARDYCADLDVSIARGFNPELAFIVSQTLHDTDCCIQTHVCAKLDKDATFGEKNPANLKNFGYHCAHVFRAYSDCMISIYGAKGYRLSSQVIDTFAEKFGEEMADELLKSGQNDFSGI